MKLAHEFRRPDFKRMLREMSVSEYFFWCKYFGKRPFMLEMIDYAQSSIVSSAYNVAAGKAISSAQDFSVLNHVVRDSEMTDEQIEDASGATSGVLRIESD
ncbi:phage tail assembly protein T [Pasteurella multocida]